MAKPRAGDWLADEMDALREAGVTTLVSALTAAEARELGLDAAAGSAEAAGLRYVELPIEDRSTPTLAVAEPTLRKSAAEVQAGGHVAIHCRFGIGRSSLIAASSTNVDIRVVSM
jgi:protein-tyrosine phosphatase